MVHAVLHPRDGDELFAVALLLHLEVFDKTFGFCLGQAKLPLHEIIDEPVPRQGLLVVNLLEIAAKIIVEFAVAGF